MRFGIVAEGPSDFMVIEAFVRRIVPGCELQRIHPDMAVGGLPYGWRGVKAWCVENGPRLEAIMRGVRGRELDALVVHIDCSMADKVGARKLCPPARATADALRAVVTQDWLGQNAAPRCVILATPAQTTDAWVVAALDPPFSGLATLECMTCAEDELVRRRLLRRKDGEIKKPRARYEPLAEAAGNALAVVCGACTEARRFADDARAVDAAFRLGGWPALAPP